jgi:hypothetical protein
MKVNEFLERYNPEVMPTRRQNGQVAWPKGKEIKDFVPSNINLKELYST